MKVSKSIDTFIDNLPEWQKALAIKARKIIHDVDPEIVEERKWETPVFTHKKIVCAIGGFKNHIKINFFKGASLRDSRKVFNAGLEAKLTRGIDLFEGDMIDEAALKELLEQAVKLNLM